MPRVPITSSEPIGSARGVERFFGLRRDAFAAPAHDLQGVGARRQSGRWAMGLALKRTLMSASAPLGSAGRQPDLAIGAESFAHAFGSEQRL